MQRGSLFREELQRAVGGGDLTHGVAAALSQSRGRRLVVDVDAVVRPLDGRRAGGRAEEAGEASGQRERESEKDEVTFLFEQFGLKSL